MLSEKAFLTIIVYFPEMYFNTSTSVDMLFGATFHLTCKFTADEIMSDRDFMMKRPVIQSFDLDMKYSAQHT